jgi:hypothetical protein
MSTESYVMSVDDLNAFVFWRIARASAPPSPAQLFGDSDSFMFGNPTGVGFLGQKCISFHLSAIPVSHRSIDLGNEKVHFSLLSAEF